MGSALQRAVRRLRARQAASEDGFTLIEVVVATSILFVVMTSIAYLGTIAFADVAQARVRQTGTAVANQALEQVRALPIDVVAQGLDTTDIAGDPAITFDGTTHRYGGERLVVHGSTTSPMAPLVPHASTQTIDDIPYTTRVYVTHYEDDLASGAFRVTAVVQWVASLRPSAANEAQAQTVIFSPSSNTSCQSTATHPYPGPCLGYFHGGASVSPAGIQIRPMAAGVPIIEGSMVDELTVALTSNDASVETEDISLINASATTSGARARSTDGTVQERGFIRWSAQADSDGNPTKAPHYDAQPPPNGMSSPQANYELPIVGSNTTMTLTGGSDAGGAIAAVEASTAYPCFDALGAAVTNALPCGIGRVEQGAASAVTMNIPGHRAFTLLSVGPGSADGHVRRAAAPVSGICPTTSGEGCVLAVERQETGAIRLGGLPFAFLDLLPGFESLVRIDNYTTTVTAAAGLGTAAPSVTRTGTLSFWNDTLGLYQSLGIEAGTSRSLNCNEVSLGQPCIPALDLTALTTGIRIRISSDLRTGTSSTTACATATCELSEASAQSLIVGTITYEITSGSNPISRFSMHVDLGTVTAKASYIPRA